jgi:hypothetical protein
MYDRNDPSSSNASYEEFGIKEYATITTTGTPRGSAPPGATNIHLSSSYINYSTNTNHSVTISIPDLHLNGNLGIPFNIAADRFLIQNMNATTMYSDMATQTSFSGPNSPLYIWGKFVGPVLIAAPYNGTRSAGPFTDHFASFGTCTVLDWWLTDVPAGLPNGVYLGTITLTLDH